MGLTRTKDLKLTGEIADGAVTNDKVASGAGIALTKMSTDLSNVVLGAGAGYKVAKGSVAVTGTQVVATGLTAIEAAAVTLRADPALTGYWASCTWAAGNLTIKVWKPTGVADVTPLAGSAAIQVDWLAMGT